MKKTLGLIFAVIFLAFFGFSKDVFASRDINNFYFKKFTAHYHLSKGEDGRSKMHVVEELTAVFPYYDQNHGIERAIPDFYQNHPVFKGGFSVTRNGVSEDYRERSNSGGNKVFRIGKKREYVRGEQEYKIEYDLSDVINDGSDFQELYWNVNGTQWSQVFGKVEAYVHIDDSIKGDFLNEINCFAGALGSSNSCDGKKIIDDKTVYFSQYYVPKFSNLTIALKFKKSSFEPYKDPPLQKNMPYVFTAWVVFVVGAILWAIFAIIVKVVKNKSEKIIVPQYTPPSNVDVFQASLICSGSYKAVAAMIVDFAIRGNIKIIEKTSGFGVFSKAKKFKIEPINYDNLAKRDVKFLDDICKVYGDENKKIISSAQNRLSSLITSRTNSFFKSSFYVKNKIRPAEIGFLVIFFALDIIGFATIAILGKLGLFYGFDGYISVLVFCSMFFGGLVVSKNSIYVLSNKGRQAHAHLQGLKMYMQMAEADRIRVLQSVDGAERILDNGAEKVKLYEKLLPYAIIFGIEKSWSRVLEMEYSSNQDYLPVWYIGHYSAFSSGEFSKSINSFSSSITASSGGSDEFSDGGFSGGGGGGGGGGGW